MRTHGTESGGGITGAAQTPKPKRRTVPVKGNMKGQGGRTYIRNRHHRDRDTPKEGRRPVDPQARVHWWREQREGGTHQVACAR
jgi:hypothetical protein